MPRFALPVSHFAPHVQCLYCLLAPNIPVTPQELLRVLPASTAPGRLPPFRALLAAQLSYPLYVVPFSI